MVRIVESSTIVDRIMESSTRCGSYKLLDNCCTDSEECNRTRVCDFKFYLPQSAATILLKKLLHHYIIIFGGTVGDSRFVILVLIVCRM